MKQFSPSPNRGHNLRPPDLYEYFVDNYWFETIDFDNQQINEPLRGSHSADVVIIGGGYTGLSAAYHIRQRFPEKKIVLLEGAFCGYGASGRNGGFCIYTDLVGKLDSSDPEVRQRNLDVSMYGPNFIKKLIAEHGVDCDFEENGMLGVALTQSQAERMKRFADWNASFGVKSEILEGPELEAEIKSPLFLAGIKEHQGAILNPAKLAREMKRVVEEIGVEIRERSVVTRITPGNEIHIDTELGEIRAPILVLATNAYSHKLGFFKNRVFPIGVFQVATEPLSHEQWESIGWQNRQGLYDMRVFFSYSILTPDRRIVMGGIDNAYYAFDGLTTGNDKTITQQIEKNLFAFFPQLEGLKIEHAWGGATTYTMNEIPSVGRLDDYPNVYYGVGLSEGVPTTQTFGRIIADLMAGDSNDFTNHYVVNYKIPYAGTASIRSLFGGFAKWMWKRSDRK